MVDFVVLTGWIHFDLDLGLRGQHSVIDIFVQILWTLNGQRLK